MMLSGKEFDDHLIHYSWYQMSSADPVILFIQGELGRNCSDLPFPSQMIRKTAQEFKNRVEKAFSKDDYFSQWKYLSCQKKDLPFLKLLTELFILPHSFHNNISRKSLYFSPINRLLLTLLNKEHFSFYTIEVGKNLDAAYFQLRAIERYLEKIFPYAYHKKYGYLISQYNFLGTALKFRVVMHLPYIMEKVNFNVITKSFLKNGIKIVPFYWNSLKYPGLYIIENVFTLGLEEEEIISLMKEAVSSLEFMEIRAREKAFKENPLQNSNLSISSLALLRSSSFLSREEMIKLLLRVRTGVERGLLKPLNIKTINRCICAGQPAHIELLSGRKALNEKDLNLMRSKVIKKELDTVFEDNP